RTLRPVGSNSSRQQCLLLRLSSSWGRNPNQTDKYNQLKFFEFKAGFIRVRSSGVIGLEALETLLFFSKFASIKRCLSNPLGKGTGRNGRPSFLQMKNPQRLAFLKTVLRYRMLILSE